MGMYSVIYCTRHEIHV